LKINDLRDLSRPGASRFDSTFAELTQNKWAIPRPNLISWEDIRARLAPPILEETPKLSETIMEINDLRKALLEINDLHEFTPPAPSASLLASDKT